MKAYGAPSQLWENKARTDSVGRCTAVELKLALQVLSLTEADMADEDKVKKAYRAIAKVVHPDIQKEPGRFEGIAGVVNEAYETIQKSPKTAQVGAGAYSAASHVGHGVQTQSDTVQREYRRPETVELTFQQLLELYRGSLNLRTSYGNTVEVTLPKLPKLGAILVDTVVLYIRSDSGELTVEVPFRKTYRADDMYEVKAVVSECDTTRGRNVSIRCGVKGFEDNSTCAQVQTLMPVRLAIRLDKGIRITVDVEYN